MELIYKRAGDYYIPDLALGDDTEYQIGRYGRMHEKFLKEHRSGTYAQLSLFGDLQKYLHEIDTACNERLDILIPAMAKREGVTEALKAADQMEWVGRMNNIRDRAIEIVNTNLIYI